MAEVGFRAEPSALPFMTTVFPGLTAGSILCRRYAPGRPICGEYKYIGLKALYLYHTCMKRAEGPAENWPDRQVGIPE